MDIVMNIQFINGLSITFTEINICLLLIVRQSTGKLDLTWPPSQADEEQRQLPEVEDFLFESLLKGTICVLNFFSGTDCVCHSHTGVGNIVVKVLGRW